MGKIPHTYRCTLKSPCEKGIYRTGYKACHCNEPCDCHRQRLTCCVSLLFTTMLTNAMWYQSDDVEHDQVVRLGPITFSAAALLVSIYSSLFVIPINLIIVQLFRKSKPANWEEKAEEEEEKYKCDSEAELEKEGSQHESSDEESDVESGSESDSTVSGEGEGKKEGKTGKEPWWRQQYPLPHWCVYVAWGVAVTSIVVSAFFVIMYSLEFGKQKSEAWLSALVFSFTESVIVIQPFKVSRCLFVVSWLICTCLFCDVSAGVTGCHQIGSTS